MSVHALYLAELERIRNIDSRVLGSILGRGRSDFEHRGWITEDGHLTRVMVPFLDSEEEVEVNIDADAEVFRYRSPQQRTRSVSRPLSEIALYTLHVDVWLNHLCDLMQIEPSRISRKRCRVHNHLWHLGDMRIAGTHEFAPIFVGRLWERAPQVQTQSVLSDPIWSRGGIVLVNRPAGIELPHEHVARGLDEFVFEKDGQDHFDVKAFDRVLCGFMAAAGEAEPDQFLQGVRLRLPHFQESRLLSDAQARIVKVMWGVEGKAPPAMTWKDVNTQVNSGYHSFDDAFGSKEAREDVLALVKRGYYQIRRR